MKESIYLLLTSHEASVLFRAWALMLLHSMWQGMLLHITASVLLRFAKQMTSALRYNILLIHFFIFLVLCGCTLVIQLRTSSTGFLLAVPGPTLRALSYISWWSFIIWPWLIAFLFRIVRFGWSLTNNYRTTRPGNVETNSYWQHRLDQLAKLLGISTKVRLLESSFINVPAIIGVVKPVILVPMGVLASLPADQLEAVLLHELAHICRRDYLVNLVQAIMDAIFFFNPALQWFSARLREEREHCCDDIAIAHVNKVTFVKALVSFQEHYIYRQAFPLAFTGQQGQLLARVSRITGRSISPSRRSPVQLLTYLAPVLLLGWFYINYTTSPLQRKTAISAHIDLQQLAKMDRMTTGITNQLPQFPATHKNTNPSRSISMIKYMGVMSSGSHGIDSISLTSSAPEAMITNNDQAQSEYKQRIADYNLKMVEYHETLKAYDEEMVQHQKRLQAYNEEMVQHKKKLQLYNEQMANHLDDLPSKPSG